MSVLRRLGLSVGPSNRGLRYGKLGNRYDNGTTYPLTHLLTPVPYYGSPLHPLRVGTGPKDSLEPIRGHEGPGVKEEVSEVRERPKDRKRQREVNPW